MDFGVYMLYAMGKDCGIDAYHMYVKNCVSYARQQISLSYVRQRTFCVYINTTSFSFLFAVLFLRIFMRPCWNDSHKCAAFICTCG